MLAVRRISREDAVSYDRLEHGPWKSRTTTHRQAVDAHSSIFPDATQAAKTAFAPATDERTATAYTRRLTHTHDENFSVVSFLLPQHLRQDFCNVYAFCRIADDLADEIPDREHAHQALDLLKQQAHACFDGRCQTALFLALRSTIRKHDLPIQPFLDLIDAFQQDQRVTRYESFDQLLDYCRRSANPVGRLVLYMCGYRDERRQLLADKTCTALQLTNFWQDVRRDLLERDRIYIPRQSMQHFAVTEQQLRQSNCDPNYRRLIRFEVDRTDPLFTEGDSLLPLLSPAAASQIALYGMGGRAVLHAIRRQNYDTLTRRPALSAWQKTRLLFFVLARRLFPRGAP